MIQKRWSQESFFERVSNAFHRAARFESDDIQEEEPGWKILLERIKATGLSSSRLRGGSPEVHYLLDLSGGIHGEITLRVVERGRKKNGDLKVPHPVRLSWNQVENQKDPSDRRILTSLAGARVGYSGLQHLDDFFVPTVSLLSEILPHLAQTGRAWIRPAKNRSTLAPLLWDSGAPWELWLEVTRDEEEKAYWVQGSLRRGSERIALNEPDLVLPGGILFLRHGLASRYQASSPWSWITHLRQQGRFSVPFEDREKFLEQVIAQPRLPRLDVPDELRFEERAVTPRFLLKLSPPDQQGRLPDHLLAELELDYDGNLIREGTPGEVILLASPPRRILRDIPAELTALGRLKDQGFRPAFDTGRRKMVMGLHPRRLAGAVNALVSEGWRVEAEGKLYRRAGAFRLEVSSGIDWFDLAGGADFEGQWVPLPRLLAALKKGEGWVVLGDGTLGMLPEEWLRKYQLLDGLGDAEGEGFRFRKNQVGLLDAVLAAQPDVSFDEAFGKAREALRCFEGIRPAAAGPGFEGQLRPYQEEGLGWLHFLRDFGLGGCLADDMGLGKTVQVLALLEERRRNRDEAGESTPPPSLVVVPRSLIFNWQSEAARFAPRLRVLDHTGVGRAVDPALFARHDLLLTTYGTLRRDILELKECRFDYVILDEAQAAKNSGSETAKAVRLLRADHRLALSGTPVENHLRELWSLFEFLNPGMLGASSALCGGAAGGRAPDPATLEVLARALRPLILRRTKEQVARDLPAKVEQTLWCELEPEQRSLYQELRDHYRRSLLKKVETDGIKTSKLQVLEALLRLRQAALHPGLVDPAKRRDPSCKLEVLLPRLVEVVEEGHKALVFSQFTRLLGILREKLEAQGIPYEYLDGRTRDREAKVRRFQEEAEPKLFLISLKAGGLGLNLTSAGYVFLLDPWWNPAVEAQAIDRAHRIGQDKQVFAYRLIARETVEEKILELQQSKRRLAASIIGEENSLLSALEKEDLEALLS